jgi:uncharacterized protein (DUF1778 family)
MAFLRTARINIRATNEQDTLIRRAADAQRKSVSEFVLDSACRSAESALFDAKTILLDESGWNHFMEALERDAKEIPELVGLFREKAPWD